MAVIDQWVLLSEECQYIVANTKTKKGSTQSQLIWLLLILFVLIVMSAGGTLIVVGAFDGGVEASSIGSISDAESICSQRVRKNYGRQMNAMTVDDRSSRYDESSGRYKIFYEVDVYREGGRQNGVKIFYVNCYVSANKGEIEFVEYLEQKDFQPKAGRRTHGNPFGF